MLIKNRRKCIYHRPLFLDLTFLQNPLRPTARTSYSLVYSIIHFLNVLYNPHHVLYSLLFSCVLLIIQVVFFANKKKLTPNKDASFIYFMYYTILFFYRSYRQFDFFYILVFSNIVITNIKCQFRIWLYTLFCNHIIFK